MIRSFEGKMPKVADTAFVSEAAYVIGEVEIGENSSIWPGAVLRGDFATIRIGNNTQVEDNCVVHAAMPLLIGNNVHIGHGAVVHGAKVGDNTLIGNNATILDGAEVGDFCIIGANCLVSEGMKIPNRSFAVGVPAHIKGETLPAQIARVEMGVKAYVELTRKYKQQPL